MNSFASARWFPEGKMCFLEGTRLVSAFGESCDFVFTPSRTDLVVQSSRLVWRNPRREIYNLSMVSGPVLLNIEGKCWICILFGITQLKKNWKVERNRSKFGLRSYKSVQKNAEDWRGQFFKILRLKNPNKNRKRNQIFFGFFTVVLRISDNQGSGKPGAPVFTTRRVALHGALLCH